MLYNKWRPKRFSDVSGQPHITKTLLSQLENGRAAHAYLFTGSKGTGKTTCAKILARAINCQSLESGEPCNICEPCLGILSGRIPDVLEIDAASNSGVDYIRALREEASYTPVMCKKRVYIIDEVHGLSKDAFNALLKTLEEPPPHVVFIFATTESHKVPPTISSRCQRFSFRRLSPQIIEAQLTKICEAENISSTPEALSLIAQIADGAMRDALSLLDQCSSAADEGITENSVRETLGISALADLADWLAESGDIAKSLSRLNSFYQSGLDISAIFDQLSSLLRNLLIGQMTGDLSITRLPEETASKLSANWPKAKIIFALSQFSEAKLTRSGDKKLEADLCLIKIAAYDSAPQPLPSPTPAVPTPPPQPSQPPPPQPQTQPQRSSNPSQKAIPQSFDELLSMSSQKPAKPAKPSKPAKPQSERESTDPLDNLIIAAGDLIEVE